MSFVWNPLPRRGAASRSHRVRWSRRATAARRRWALEPLEERTVLSTAIPLSPTAWVPLGPAPIVNGQTPPDNGLEPPFNTGSPVSGRIAALAASPTDPNTIYVAAANGGVWKTTDGGQTWTPLTDGQATLHMGAIAIAPQNENVVYAGTGEANGGSNTRNPYLASSVFAGKGVLKTTDGGKTWTLLGQSIFDRTSISKVVIDPTDPTANTVYVAVGTPGIDGLAKDFGVWKTTDGGQTWTLTTGAISRTDAYTDLVMDPRNPQVLYAAVGQNTVDFNALTSSGDAANGVYVTTNGGKSWAPAGNFPGGKGDGRITLTISNPTGATAATLYAAIVDPDLKSATFWSLLKMEKSTDGGKTWSDVKAPDYMNGQGFYDTTLIASPTDPNLVFAGGSGTYQSGMYSFVESTDGGSTWTDIAGFGGQTGLHPDHHAIGFDAGGKLLDGNDGGIWRLADPSPSAPVWDDINGNLQITTFTGIALDPSNPNVAYGGSQDNGTEKFTGTAQWTLIRYGDGGFVAVDPNNPQTIYHTYFGVGLERSDDGGNTWTDVTPTNAFGGLFYSPYEIDPSNSNKLIYASNELDVTYNKGSSWSTLAMPGQRGFNPYNDAIDAVAFAPSDDNVIYATAGGHVYVTYNGGNIWYQSDLSQASDGFNKIYVDPSNKRVAYIVREQYNDAQNVGHVFETTNGGITWTDISGDLPDVPVYTVIKESLYGLVDKLIVGTDAGVYASTDDGQHWAKLATGMPNVQVTSLEYNAKLNILAAGTHGRGMWELLGDNLISATAPATLPTPIEGNATSFATLATFTNAGGAGLASDYTATVDWGDATTATGTVTAGLGSSFNIAGTHLYAEAGTYTVVISIVDKTGAVGQLKETITVADAPLSAVANPVSGVEGGIFSGAIATFTDGNPSAPLSDFNAVIQWGDGNISSGTIAYDPVKGQFVVSGSNAYPEEGSFDGQVKISDVDGSTATATFTAKITDAPLTNPVGVPIAATEGNLFNGAVATFTDANPGAPAGDFTAKIVWGNGSTTAGTIVPLGGGQFQVVGSTLYADEGQFPVSVSIADVGGQTASATTTATVADAPIAATVASSSSVEGQAAAITGNFTDGDPTAPSSDYTVVVDFGDSSSVTLTGADLAPLGKGAYSFALTHVYTEQGAYQVTLAVADKGGSTAKAVNNASVVDAPISAVGANASTPEGQTMSGVLVATITDGYAGAPASDFSATVDWGDGTTSTSGDATDPVTITPLGGGKFAVKGTHAYAEAASYPISVSIADVGGSTASASGTATATDVPLSAGGPSTVTAQEGVAFVGAVGSFTDANPLATPRDFFGGIDWGDGTSSVAVITQPNGPGTPFVVSAGGGGHAYTEETAAGQSYPISLVIYDVEGQTVKLTGTATVADAPVTTAAGPAITGLVEGSKFSGLVATFTDAYAGAPQSDYSATVDWGDGSFSQGKITYDPVKQVYDVTGAHTFTEFGSYTVTVTVSDVGGSQSSSALPATIADAPIASASAPNLSAVSGRAFQGTVAQFVDGNPFGSAGDFTATIAWGDGTTSAGAISQPNGVGTPFLVAGSHTYTTPGAAISVSIRIADAGGSTIGASSHAHILVPLGGGLTSSHNNGATANNRAQFAGSAEPGSVVEVFATANNGAGATTLVAKGTANGSGQWSLTTSPLGDGRYTFKAQMIDPATGAVVQQTSIQPTSAIRSLVVDTTGPVVRSVSLNPSNGQLKVTLYDALSGFNKANLNNRSNYQLGFAVPQGVQALPITGLTVVPGAPGSGLEFVTATFALGSRVRPGTYVVTLNANGLRDQAGNILVERTFVTFPQSTNSPNPNYVAAITVSANLTASAPQVYVPYAEQVAANQYARNVRRRR